MGFFSHKPKSSRVNASNKAFLASCKENNVYSNQPSFFYISHNFDSFAVATFLDPKYLLI
jgi:hypothetical protein